MVLDLKTISYQVTPDKNKKGTTLGIIKTNTGKIPRSPEEIFQLSTLAPASTGSYITNSYCLLTDVRFDACCCPTVPNFTVPLTVIPVCHEASYGFVEP